MTAGMTAGKFLGKFSHCPFCETCCLCCWASELKSIAASHSCQKIFELDAQVLRKNANIFEIVLLNVLSLQHLVPGPAGFEILLENLV